MKKFNIFSKNSLIKFEDLYNHQGLIKLDNLFLGFFEEKDSDLFAEFNKIKVNRSNYDEKIISDILIEIAKILEQFLAELFDIDSNNQELKKFHQDLDIIYKVKRDFVQRKIAKKFKKDDVCENSPKIDIEFQKAIDFELNFAQRILEADEKELKKLEEYAAWAIFSKKGRNFHENGTLFRLAQKINHENLLDCETSTEIIEFNQEKLKDRNGFSLTDEGYDINQALGEANYCIFCHKQDKDSCSKGLFEKDLKSFKKDFFGEELEGCPLEEKISEMNLLKSQGFSIASLAMAIIDNPMIAATGHRICNDCMKSCIYQKQDPVDIPQIESRILKDVLNLSYGFEIYSLLTRWNPLKLTSHMAKQDSGYKIMIAGLGPAGFTLAHYLLNEGHLVVAIDGLKIEPLDKSLSGIDLDGNRHNFEPIKNVSDIYEDLNERSVYGFGGVAEYGITVRWDKNFLKVIRLLLERRQNFQMFGGVRLGSAFDCKEALENLGFDHVALCLGAGWPNILNIKNNFVKGVRLASDFLMALQLTGAMRQDLVTNLQVRLPILVVGGGLTAIDTACEALNYYKVQVQKFFNQYQDLSKKIGRKRIEEILNEEEKLIAYEFIDHAQKIAEIEKNNGSVIKLLQDLGGSTLIYRKNITNAPSYKINHLEINKALEEGLKIIDNATPLEIVKDDFNHIESLKVQIKYGDIEKIEEIKARSLFIGIGTSPNKAPAYEDRLKFTVENNNFKILDLSKEQNINDNFYKNRKIDFFAAKNNENNKFVSFFGDTHNDFSGSVVKAMASAKIGYNSVNDVLEKLPKNRNYSDFLENINQELIVKVKELNIWSENIYELVVFAPLLAKNTKLGHIFRLHNYHFLAKQKKDVTLAMEGVAVTVYKVDQENGLISVVIINVGASTAMVKNLKINENIIFMGPTGSPAIINKDKNVILLATGRGLFPFAALSREYRRHGCNVTLFCGFRKSSDIAKLDYLKKSADNFIISIEDDDKKIINNNCDENIQFYQDDIVQAFVHYVKNRENSKEIDLILTMGNEEMMHKIAKVRHCELKNELKDSHIGITSLNNPMQCMLKGVCSQCLQKKIDQKTGKEHYFYSCINQDQKMDEIDFEFLKNRCNQNSLQEKITNLKINN